MGILIDTSILIAYERGRIDLPSQIVARRAADVRLSVITASELLHGIERATDPGIRSRRSAFVEQMLRDFPLVAMDLETARMHASLEASLELAGTPIGCHDCWLAASCRQHQLVMVTANEREFRRVPGLVVENWMSS